MENAQSVCWTGRGSRTEKCASVLGRWSELSIKQKLSVIRDGGQDIPFQFGTGYVILKGQAPVRGDSGSLVYLKMANGVEAVGMVIAAGHSDLSMMIPVQSSTPIWVSSPSPLNDVSQKDEPGYVR